MTKKPFDESRFTATSNETAGDKAHFCNHFARFVEGGFKRTVFQQWFYRTLSDRFHHIAHFNADGFYSMWFTSANKRLRFLENAVRASAHGDPRFCHCDAERELQTWIVASGQLDAARKAAAAETEAVERAMLAKLKAKYEGARA